MDAIQKAIEPKMRHHYMQEPHHMQTIHAVNQLNSCFQDITSLVKNYRVELGTGLELALECYTGLIIQQYENFYKRRLTKEVEFEQMIEQCDK